MANERYFRLMCDKSYVLKINCERKRIINYDFFLMARQPYWAKASSSWFL